MLIAFWIISGLLALVMLAAGFMKAARPKAALASSGMGWVEDFSATSVKLIGIAEVLGAIGLILPPLLGIAAVLNPIAAIALAILMAGAVVTHVRRKEPAGAAIGLLVLSIATAVIGFIVVL